MRCDSPNISLELPKIVNYRTIDQLSRKMGDYRRNADKLTPKMLPNEPILKRNLIEGLMLGLQALACFDDKTPRITPTELAQRLNISRAAARRYLLTLVHTGYAEVDGRYYQPTPKVLGLSHAYTGSARLPKTVQPFLQRITKEIQFSCNCAVLENHDAVYIASVTVPRIMGSGLDVGTRLPAHTTAAGRLLLASLSDERLHDWINQTKLVAFTVQTPLDKVKVLDELIKLRARGYEFTENLYEFGLRGIAVPLRNRQGETKAAIGVSMASATCSAEEALQRCLPALQSVAHSLIDLI
jgi:IclR family transcriptional regulator, pca regulon regulatory protein